MRLHASVSSRVVASPLKLWPGRRIRAHERRSRIRVEAGVIESERSHPFTYPYSDGPIIVDGQIAHSLTEQRFEIVQSLDPFLEKEVLTTFRDHAICLIRF